MEVHDKLLLVVVPHHLASGDMAFRPIFNDGALLPSPFEVHHRTSLRHSFRTRIFRPRAIECRTSGEVDTARVVVGRIIQVVTVYRLAASMLEITVLIRVPLRIDNGREDELFFSCIILIIFYLADIPDRLHLRQHLRINGRHIGYHILHALGCHSVITGKRQRNLVFSHRHRSRYSQVGSTCSTLYGHFNGIEQRLIFFICKFDRNLFAICHIERLSRHLDGTFIPIDVAVR